MILLNWLLGFGALAFTIPLAIHLLFRNRFEMVDWGAMQFLQSVVRQNRRRMQLRNLLLLLIRCAIPMLLAFCMARPVMTQWRQPRGDSPVSMVVVVDNSYSMAARHDDQRRRMDVANEAAKQITQSLGRGSEITLLSSDGVIRTADPQSAGNQIDQIDVAGAPLDLDALVSRALRIAADSTLPNRQIVMITDRSASDFSQAMLDALPAIAERVKAVSPVPDLAWIDPFAAVDSEYRNIRVHRVEPSAAVAVPGQVVPWFVEARIDGLELRNVDLTVRINGKIAHQIVVPVRGNAATAVIPMRIDQTGTHGVEIAFSANQNNDVVESQDDFSPDDRVWRDYKVINPVLVWLMDGTASDKPLGSDTDFLAVALSPFSLSSQATADNRPTDLFRTRKVRAGRLDKETIDGAMPAVVVMADVAKPTAQESQWLIDFVKRGGTLVVFAGPSIDSSWYDQQLSDGEFGPLLPMAYGNVREVDSALAIDDSRLAYPPLVTFSNQEKGTLSSAGVTKWRELIARQSEGPEPQVLIRLEDGQPLFVLGRFGKGQVLQVATTSNEAWTTLPLRPVFVPLMQRLLSHLAVGRGTIQSPSAGEPLVVNAVTLGSKWTLTTPDGQTHSIEALKVNHEETGDSKATSDAQDGATAVVAEQPLAEPGDASLFWPTARVAGGYRFESEEGQSIWAVVNVPPSDLKPVVVDPSIQRQASERLGAAFYGSTEDFLIDDGNRRFGRSIWHFVLIALVAAMILEPVVQQRRGKPVAV